MDEPDDWVVDEQSEEACFSRWLAASHKAGDEQRVFDCLLEIRLAPLERGRPQETPERPPGLADVVFLARVHGANIGILYVVSLESKAVVIAEIGQL